MTDSPPASKKRRRVGVIEPPKLNILLSELNSSSSISSYSDEEVPRLLEEAGFSEEIISIFTVNRIKRNQLIKMSHSLLSQMGISSVGDQIELLDWIQSLSTGYEKVFNDPIHGHIELHPLLITITDTRQFQRLRYIKQLGGGYYVFPGASHNRFEHSLGVSYLAGEFVESLQRRQVELCITPSDILCVKIAGLCHDLGHGPFSHMFDGHFIPKVPGMRKWKHEQGSVDMLDHLIKENNLWSQFERYGLTEQDLVFIKELIVGPPEGGEGVWPYKGRPIEKSFLYEIVANKRNGVDVDKWDYFARDCHCLGIPNSFDCKRYMKFARVIKVDGMYQICCRDKEVVNLYEMFHTRNVLHRRAYQHKTSQAVEILLTEGLLAANDHYRISGKNGALVRISDAIDDMVAFTNLTDSIVHMIQISTDPNLKKAQQLFHQVEIRQLYKCIGQTQPSTELTDSEDEVKRQILSSIPNCTLTVSDLHVRIVTFDYGMKAQNPIDRMRFYIKSEPNRAVRVRRDQVSQMLPVTFVEKNIRVYCKRLDQISLDTALKCFVTWCNKQNHLMTPKGEWSFSGPADSIDSLEAVSAIGSAAAADSEQDFTPYGTPFGTPAKDSPPATTNATTAVTGQILTDTRKRLSFIEPNEPQL